MINDAVIANWDNATVQWTPKGYELTVPLTTEVDDRIGAVLDAVLSNRFSGADTQVTAVCYRGSLCVSADHLFDLDPGWLRSQVQIAIQTANTSLERMLRHEETQGQQWLDMFKRGAKER